MSDRSPTDKPTPARRPAPFRPRFTISIVYLAGFTLFFMMAMVLPDLLGVLSAGGDEAVMQQRAAEIAREHARPHVALALSLLATALGGYFEVLPGLRER